MTNIMKNITNSGLEQISFKQNSMIYKVNEKPKFAYYIYTGEVEIISKNDYVIGTLKEGELFGEISSLFNKEQNADPILKAVIRTLSLRLNDSNIKSEEIWRQLHLLSSIKKEVDSD